MAEVVLFHHALGLTPGIVAFADELRRAGHTVHTPDLFQGRTFDTIEDLRRGLQDFVDGVVPILQQRGLFRTEYAGHTLREHFGLARPVGRPTNRAAA